MSDSLQDPQRIVITGVGLTAPNGDSLTEFRAALLAGKSGVVPFETRYMPPVIAGVCNFDEFRHQRKKDRRRGTRAGSISIYCANEAVQDSGLNWPQVKKSRVGVYIGITEHGNVETETRSTRSSSSGTTHRSGRITTIRAQWPTTRPAR